MIVLFTVDIYHHIWPELSIYLICYSYIHKLKEWSHESLLDQLHHCVQALLLSEKQAAEEAKKASADAETRNMDLAKKLEEAERKMDQLQDSTQRYIYIYKS